MKLLKIFIFILAALFLAFYSIGFFIPKTYSVSRNISINAPISDIFNEVNHLNNTEKWSPWLTSDSTMVFQYDSISSGLGASYTWSSATSGTGSLTIIESIPYQRIKSQLDFGEGSIAEESWNFQQATPTSVIVTWSFHGIAKTIPERYFGLLMDKVIGITFEKGLESLKNVVEK